MYLPLPLFTAVKIIHQFAPFYFEREILGVFQGMKPFVHLNKRLY